MFGLWNELFGFPVNSCDYEAIECNRSYIPILNRDNDNEFVWSLADPLEGGIDAKNVSFSTKDIQKWPASITKVDQALEHLMSKIEQSKSSIKSFTLALDEDGETLKGTIVYVDDSGVETPVEASINIKDIVEGWESLTLQDLTVNKITGNEAFIESSHLNNAVIGEETVTKSTIGTATINKETVSESTITKLGAGQAHATSLTAVQATVSDEFNSNGAATFNGVNTFNTDIKANSDINVAGTVDTEKLHVGNVANIDGQLNANENAKFAKNVSVEGNTTVNSMTANGYATFNDKSTFNEDATFNDTIVANSNATFNGHTDVDTLTAKGQATFNDDVDIDQNLNVDGNSVVEGNSRVEGNLTVKKAVEFKDNLNVQKKATIGTNLEVVGKTTTANMEVTGRADINEEQVQNSTIANLTVTDSFTLPDGALDQFQARSEKDQPNGYAGLDNNGKLDINQLPDDIANGMHYRGTWEPSSDYPENPKLGDMYKVIAEGEKSGKEFHVGDAIVYNGRSWDLIPSADDVISVNGRRGAVEGLEEASNKVEVLDKTNPSKVKYGSEYAIVNAIGAVENRISTDEAAVAALQDVVAGKANAADVYTKPEVDDLVEHAVETSQAFQDLEDEVSQLPTKEYVDGRDNLKANVSDVYDKLTTDNLLADKAHITHTHTIADVAGLSEKIGTIEGHITGMADEIDDLEGDINTAKTDIVDINARMAHKADLDGDGKILLSQLPADVVTVENIGEAVRNAITTQMLEQRLGVSFRTYVVPLNGVTACYNDEWITERANVLWTWTGELEGHINWTVQAGKICVESTETETGNFYITLVQQA